MRIGQFDTTCRITGFLSHDDLESEINSLRSELTDILKKLDSLKNESANQGDFGIDDEASPQEIWTILSNVSDDSLLVEPFNSLKEFKRRELADYIFANCNIFTGKGAFFSARYVQETALLAD